MKVQWSWTFLVLYFCAFHMVISRYKKARKYLHYPTKGIRCYNCLSFDHPGCWDPAHPDNANFSIPNVDCWMPGIDFYCVIITTESAMLVETGQEIGPVVVRTCVPAKRFRKSMISYHTCHKISKELAVSEVFSSIIVKRPKCQLCNRDLCSDTEVLNLRY